MSCSRRTDGAVSRPSRRAPTGRRQAR
jgi:hypothetical protein